MPLLEFVSVDGRFGIEREMPTLTLFRPCRPTSRVDGLRDEAREAFVERDGVAVERQYFLSGSSPRVSGVCFIK